MIVIIFTPVAAHPAGLFRSVRGAKGGVEYEEQSSTGELTYITAGFVIFFKWTENMFFAA